MQIWTAGRGFSRPALLLALAAIVGLGAWAASRLGSSTLVRGPIAVPNPDSQPAVERHVGDVRHIDRSEPSELLVLDSIPPTDPARLIWFQGQAVEPLPNDEALTLDGSGGIIRFDDRLRIHRVPVRLDGRVAVGVAPRSELELWVTDETGDLLLIGADGQIAKTIEVPFGHSSLRKDELTDDVWLVRSNQQWEFRIPDHEEPLLARVSDNEGISGVGTIRVPEHYLLAELANAGHIAVGEGLIFFVPFIRDEVIAMTPRGDTVWVAHRNLVQQVEEPKFVVEDGEPKLDYAPVNLRVALGPDHRLYVLSVPGFTTAESRLDVFDAATGELQRTTRIKEPEPTIAVGADGRVYALDPFKLMTGVAPKERDDFPEFELDLMGGGQISLADLDGKVALLNFWASWCAPCREEMPALDSLRQSITHDDFVFLAMNDDIASKAAEEFISEYGFDFPVPLGRGKLQNKYRIIGLPYTVVIDRDGRIVQRWIGFAGPSQVQGLRAVIEAELEREGGMAMGGMEGVGMDHSGH